ncbi:hypothetical protein CYMTET_37998 [Cymbomonas tetramitiformis]|uniref:Uncharacterized protein n=1 Tax=Cymbomonas tetramitiformis TaxID=36881 RepID=A0AAE0CCY4_9CHLO|nr:hypothetical protein CYMTET_37998 [Cymbomonas tetramitiformis]
MEANMRVEDATKEDSDSMSHYTGKNYDIESCCLSLSRRVTGSSHMAHLSMVRRALNGPSMLKVTWEDKKAFKKKKSRPDWQGMFVWFLKSTGQHEDSDGVVNCGEEPFHQLDRGATWRVVRPATAKDAEGEVSDEYLRNGNSL